jgi:hypothetical protein
VKGLKTGSSEDTVVSSESTIETERSFRVLPFLAMVVGAILVGLGVLFLPGSLLGGIHIGAIGASIFLAGMVSTGWAATRWNMSPGEQRNWAVAFTVLGGILMVLFVVINYASFEGPVTVEEISG